MTRDEINRLVGHAAGIDVNTTEQVLVGLEKIILAEMAKGGNKFARIMGLYQNWKTK
ncbi:MAG: hypothetical protein FWE28_04355 [Oscillospiraceae bacterium]|nr:hypothetical protein [Oscillospiraceae bacterium]